MTSGLMLSPLRYSGNCSAIASTKDSTSPYICFTADTALCRVNLTGMGEALFIL